MKSLSHKTLLNRQWTRTRHEKGFNAAKSNRKSSLLSVAYRGVGVRGGSTSSPRNSEDRQKSCQIQPDYETR